MVGDSYAYVTYSHLDQKVLAKVNENGPEIIDYNVGDDKFAISETGDTVMVISAGTIEVVGSITIEDADATSITVVGVTNGSVVYYDNSKNLKVASYTTGDIVTVKEGLTFVEGYFDVSDDDAYMYFYKTVGEHKYLHRIQVVNTNESTEEMVGVYLEEDIKDEE